MKIWVIVMITTRMMILLTDSFPTKLVVVCEKVMLELSEILKPRFLKWWKDVKEKKIHKYKVVWIVFIFSARLSKKWITRVKNWSFVNRLYIERCFYSLASYVAVNIKYCFIIEIMKYGVKMFWRQLGLLLARLVILIFFCEQWSSLGNVGRCTAGAPLSHLQ